MRFLLALALLAFCGFVNAQCADPWITQGVREVVGREAKGSGDRGECSGANYGAGRWSNYPDLLAKIRLRLAEQGDAQAQFRLGSELAKGNNHVEAYQWLSLALKQGVKDALQQRRVVSARLTPKQIEQVDRTILNWRPKK